MLRHDREPSVGCLACVALVGALLTMAGVLHVADGMAAWLLG